MKVLIVDDDPLLRDLLRLALERAGHPLVVAADGRPAREQAAREAPSLVVPNVGMPEMEGFETCGRLRARSEVPVLCLTAHDDEIDRSFSLMLGADGYMTEPFGPREVVARGSGRSCGGRPDRHRRRSGRAGGWNWTRRQPLPRQRDRGDPSGTEFRLPSRLPEGMGLASDLLHPRHAVDRPAPRG